MTSTPAPHPREFATTHWSVVGAARSAEADSTRARAALETLCKIYWYPLYAFVRRRGYAVADAQDLTQAFFARFLATGGFAAADRERGRLRTYLLGALKHFLANEWHRAKAVKRGGQVQFLEWDALDPEARYALETPAADDPELSYDREWAQAVVGRALERLGAEYAAADKGALFAALKGELTGEEAPRAQTAAALGMTEGALKVAVHRLRRRYRELLRDEIAGTVACRNDVEEEMRHLVRVLRER